MQRGSSLFRLFLATCVTNGLLCVTALGGLYWTCLYSTVLNSFFHFFLWRGLVVWNMRKGTVYIEIR